MPAEQSNLCDDIQPWLAAYALGDAEMVVQHALEDGAEIRSGREVAALVYRRFKLVPSNDDDLIADLPAFHLGADRPGSFAGGTVTRHEGRLHL